MNPKNTAVSIALGFLLVGGAFLVFKADCVDAVSTCTVRTEKANGKRAHERYRTQAFRVQVCGPRQDVVFAGKPSPDLEFVSCTVNAQATQTEDVRDVPSKCVRAPFDGGVCSRLGVGAPIDDGGLVRLPAGVMVDRSFAVGQCEGTPCVIFLGDTD